MHYKKSVFRSLAMVTQLGICVITPIFLCIFVGYQIDSRFGTWFMVPLLILGTLAGGRSAWILAKKTLEQEQREDEQAYKDSLPHSGNPEFRKPKEASRIRKEPSVRRKESD